MISEKSSITLTAPRGLVPFLKQEVSSLGYPVVWASETAVGTKGTYNDSMYLNLWLRTAHHVLFQLKEFSCAGLDDLYRHVNRIPWETIIETNEYISVVASVDHPSIRDHRIVNLKCKDAIVDRIAEKKGRRPDSGSEKHSAVIAVFWNQQRCSIAIDTSGEPLSKRGYRKIPLAAPMQETLAAGLVLATGYDGDQPFVNPMCGSGTIAIEAALIGSRAAPGLTRDNFGFMHTKYFDNEAWKKKRNEAVASRTSALSGGKIAVSDNNPEAIAAAISNAQAAHVESDISFETVDFAATTIPEGSGIVIMNPEYGIRLGDEDALVTTYREIGTFLKRSCGGYKGFLFTGNSKLAGNVGLKSGRKLNFLSGKIECRLYEYDLFKGKNSA